MGDSESLKTTSRQLITGPNMYALLIREFARLRPADCKAACRVPLPFWGPAPNNQEVYWYMETPKPCASGCSQLLAELWAKVTTEFRIAAPEQETVLWKHGMRTTASKG
jgi:hypothetical protein